MAKANFLNNVSIRGYVFSTRNLEKRVSKAGNEYIGGTLNVATDDDALNVVPVNFTYVTPTDRNGNPKSTYQYLESVINGDVKTYEAVGTDAGRVRIDGDIEVNDWVSRDGELISNKRVRGSFVHALNANEPIGDAPATFECDMLAQSAVERESRDGSTYLEVRGFAFNFRDDLVPVNFSVTSEGGRQFFENEDISTASPYFGKVWGDIKSTIVQSNREVDTSNVGFGAARVKTTSSTIRTWEIAGASVNLGLGEDTITMNELKAADERRQQTLAEVRARYEARQGNTTPTGFPASAAPAAKPRAAAVSPADFKF